MVATLNDCAGVISPPNQILYQDALGKGLSISYTYTEYSFEQDILISTALPDPQDALGPVDESQIMVGVATEFLEAPEPRISPCTVDLGAQNAALGVKGTDALAGQGLLSWLSPYIGRGEGVRARG